MSKAYDRKTVSALGMRDFAKSFERLGAVFSSDDPSRAAKAASKARILIVEDDFLVSSAIEVALMQAGFDVARPGFLFHLIDCADTLEK